MDQGSGVCKSCQLLLPSFRRIVNLFILCQIAPAFSGGIVRVTAVLLSLNSAIALEVENPISLVMLMEPPIDNPLKEIPVFAVIEIPLVSQLVCVVVL